MSLTLFPGVLINLQERRKAFDVFFDTCGARLPDAQHLRDLAHLALAREALEHALTMAATDGRTGDASIDEYLTFAYESCDSAPSLWQSRILERGRRAPFSGLPRRIVRSRILARGLREGIAWQHSRWSGL
jgi:hypothetical protein